KNVNVVDIHLRLITNYRFRMIQGTRYEVRSTREERLFRHVNPHPLCSRDTPTPGALILHPVGARCPMIIPTAHQSNKARILSQLAFQLAFNLYLTVPQLIPKRVSNPTPTYLPNLPLDLPFNLPFNLHLTCI